MRGAMTICEPLVLDLADDELFKKCLGREENYRNFEIFFLNEINEKGFEAVLQKYLVDGSELANDMMYRIYMGIHNISQCIDEVLIIFRLCSRTHSYWSCPRV